MSIIKSKHASNFTVLPNEIFQTNLSAQAIGMLAYLLSLPHDWVVRKSQLMDKFNIGRDALRTILGELEHKGYFLCVREHTEGGTFNYSYIVYDKPFNGEPPIETSESTENIEPPLTGYPYAVEPPAVEPSLVNPTTTKETIIQSTNSTKDIYAFDEVKFIEMFNAITKKNFRKLDDKSKRQIKKLLKSGYTRSDIKKAIENCSKDQYHIDNPKYLTPEFITREDKFQKYYSVPTVTLRADWWDCDKLPPEEWDLLTPEQRQNKLNNDRRKRIGL